MLIAVTSPMHGQGTTTLACTLAHNISFESGVDGDDNVLIFDLNKNNNVSDNYVTAAILRTWDNYVISENNNLFKTDGGDAESIAEAFITACVKRATDGLYVTGAPVSTPVTDDMFQTFLNRANNFFRHIVVDCVPGYDENTLAVLDHADVIVVNLTQDARNLKVIEEDFLELYKKYNGRLVFVLNRYVTSMGQVKLSMTKDYVKSRLSQMRLTTRNVNALGYSAFLVEQVNKNSLLRVVEDEKSDPVFFGALENITAEVIGRGGSNA